MFHFHYQKILNIRSDCAVQLNFDAALGAVAFSRTGNPAPGDFSDAKVFRKFGDIPDDYDSAMMARYPDLSEISPLADMPRVCEIDVNDPDCVKT